MAERWVTNPLVEQFRRGGVPREIRLMAAQGLFPLKPEDLLDLWVTLASDADSGIRSAAEQSLAVLPAAELLPILTNGQTPSSVLAWVVSHRPEPEVREAALRTTSPPDDPIEAVAPAPNAPEPESLSASGSFMTEDEAIVHYLSEEERLQADKLRAVRKLYRLNTAERIITALKGTREERSILIRDPNRLVASAVLGSPRITETEIESISAMKFTLEEQELLMRLGGLFVRLNRSFGMVEGALTLEQREDIEATLDRVRKALRQGMCDELRACVQAMESASRLLEQRSSALRAAPQAARAAASGRAASDGWTAAAVEIYRVLVRARLAEVSCPVCGRSLESALVIRTDTSVGPELNEHGLSDLGAARWLAATDDLAVECGHCGARELVRATRPAGS